jgi:hypothetical protein
MHMALPQLSLVHLNRIILVHLVALILNGVDEVEILRIISIDINSMVRNGLQNIWIANGPNRTDGCRRDINMLLPSIKEETHKVGSYGRFY